MVRAEARQMLDRIYNGELCEEKDWCLALSHAMTAIDDLEAHRSHLHKFGYVKGADGKCACAYCLGDAEALANHAADLEMRNHTLQQRAERAELALFQFESAPHRRIIRWFRRYLSEVS